MSLEEYKNKIIQADSMDIVLRKKKRSIRRAFND